MNLTFARPTVSRRDGKMVMYAVSEAGRALIDAVREPETAAR